MAHKYSVITNIVVTKAVLITKLQKSLHPESKCRLLVADKSRVPFPFCPSFSTLPITWVSHCHISFPPHNSGLHAVTYDIATVHNNSNISPKQTQAGNQERKRVGSEQIVLVKFCEDTRLCQRNAPLKSKQIEWQLKPFNSFSLKVLIL